MSDPVAVPRQSAITRRRILDVTWGFVHLQESDRFTMRAVAEAAGVTRQTVYEHFGSRTGLLLAIAGERDDLEGITDLFAFARAAPTARGALVATVRTWCSYVPHVAPVARLLAREQDADGRTSAWWDHLESAEDTIRTVVERLAEEDELDHRWSVEQAADLLRSLIHPRSWSDLVERRCWSVEDFVDAQVSIATRVLLRAP